MVELSCECLGGQWRFSTPHNENFQLGTKKAECCYRYRELFETCLMFNKRIMTLVKANPLIAEASAYIGFIMPVYSQVNKVGCLLALLRMTLP